jgi:hypothetical protein
MTASNQTLEISYSFTFDDFKRDNLHPSSLLSIIFINVIPLAFIALAEIVLLILGFIITFSEFIIAFMILLPAVYALFLLLYYPLIIVFIRRSWNSYRRLPLERKWSFTSEKIIYDKGYVKHLDSWSDIAEVRETKTKIFFFKTASSVIKLTLDYIPKRALTDEQLEELTLFLQNSLSAQKLKLR